MSLGIVLYGLHLAYRASLRSQWMEFQKALGDPARTQERRLAEILRENKSSSYGAAHRFLEVSDATSYRARAPVTDYEVMEPWIQRIAKGEINVLTSDPVLMMEKTGGSTSVNKLIPYTRGLKRDFSAATDAWIYDLFSNCKGLVGTRSYWSLSPVTRKNQKTEGGLSIGFESDSEYLGPMGRYFMQKSFAVPESVIRLPSMDEWRMATCRHLLAASDLGLISVWSPSFLTLLMDFISENLQLLLKELPSKRVHQIQESLQRAGGVTGDALWPELRLVSTWVDADAADHLPALNKYFPRTQIQGKGLLATEGVISIPLLGQKDPVLAVTSHFLEFLDVEHPSKPPVLAHELKVGGVYSPLMTTSGGLYRYHLKDRVLCTGHVGATPTVRFQGKLDRVSDLCGEKVNSHQVDCAFEQARASVGFNYKFALLAPVPDQPSHYCLFIETEMDEAQLARAVETIENHLSQGHHYSYCRGLGQLGPMTYQRVKRGWSTYLETAVQAGQRAGDVKPTHFDTRKIWHIAFAKAAGTMETL